MRIAKERPAAPLRILSQRINAAQSSANAHLYHGSSLRRVRKSAAMGAECLALFGTVREATPILRSIDDFRSSPDNLGAAISALSVLMSPADFEKALRSSDLPLEGSILSPPLNRTRGLYPNSGPDASTSRRLRQSTSGWQPFCRAKRRRSVSSRRDTQMHQ
jgi:hypothetical protein